MINTSSRNDSAAISYRQLIDQLKTQFPHSIKDGSANCFMSLRTSQSETLAPNMCRNLLERIADHALTPPAVLYELANYPIAEIKQVVADNHNAEWATIWLLANDENVDVRYAVAENHNVSTDVLLHLQSDENPYVSQRATKTLMRLSCEADKSVTEPIELDLEESGKQHSRPSHFSGQSPMRAYAARLMDCLAFQAKKERSQSRKNVSLREGELKQIRRRLQSMSSRHDKIDDEDAGSQLKTGARALSPAPKIHQDMKAPRDHWCDLPAFEKAEYSSAS